MSTQSQVLSTELVTVGSSSIPLARMRSVYRVDEVQQRLTIEVRDLPEASQRRSSIGFVH